MAPILRTRKPNSIPTPKPRRKPRRTTTVQKKKPNTNTIDQEVVVSSSCSTKNSCSSKIDQQEDSLDFEVVDTSATASSTPFSTPKAKRFRIPEIVTCPPAPKKKRVLSSSPSSKCSNLQRTIPFFAPPDLELFFFVSL